MRPNGTPWSLVVFVVVAVVVVVVVVAAAAVDVAFQLWPQKGGCFHFSRI